MEEFASKPDTPLLSVIVPVYNVEDYLRQCIESILHQSYDNLEIILVDDGSKGNEGKICDEYAAKDPRIVVIHKENEGLVAARKTGIRTAKAEYITFVDGDDFIAADQYEKMMSWLIKEDPDLVAAAFTQYIDEHHKQTSCQKMPDGVYCDASLVFLHRNMNFYEKRYNAFGILPSVWNKIYKKSILLQFIDEIPDDIRLGEDCAFTFPYMLKCRKIVIDNCISGYFYRYVEGSMSKKKDLSLFSGTSALYSFLCPFYDAVHDREVSDQLELLRSYHIDITLETWMMGVKIKDIGQVCDELRDIVERSGLFVDCAVLLSYALPYKLKWKIKCISRSDWKGFEFRWKIRTFLKSLKHSLKYAK